MTLWVCFFFSLHWTHLAPHILVQVILLLLLFLKQLKPLQPWSVETWQRDRRVDMIRSSELSRTTAFFTWIEYLSDNQIDFQIIFNIFLPCFSLFRDWNVICSETFARKHSPESVPMSHSHFFSRFLCILINSSAHAVWNIDCVYRLPFRLFSMDCLNERFWPSWTVCSTVVISTNL